MQEGQLLRALNQFNYLLWLGRRTADTCNQSCRSEGWLPAPRVTPVAGTEFLCLPALAESVVT